MIARMVEGEDLRGLMRFVPHPVAVLAVDHERDKMGVTISSLVSLSLEPPLVGISIGKQASIYELLRAAGTFTVSVLGDGQEDLARRFAAGHPPIIHWDGVDRIEGHHAPRIAGALGLDRGDDPLRARCRRPHVLHRARRCGRARAGAERIDVPRPQLPLVVIDAIVFDMDGVLIQSEEVWDEVRERYVAERGGRYDAEVQRAMMGMSSTEWSRYLHETASVPDDPEAINAEVVRRMLAAYRDHLPLIDGAPDAVRRLAGRYPLAVASSSNRPLIDTVLDVAGLAQYFQATVSSEEVERGKPAPDVYLEAARRLDADPGRCAAIEDSHGGIRSAKTAGMRVIAIPNPSYPPDEESLAHADVIVRSLAELTPDLVAG